MKIFLAGIVLFCVLAVATSQIPPPSAADIQCIQRVAIRGNLNSCTNVPPTDVSAAPNQYINVRHLISIIIMQISAICRNRLCMTEIIQAYKTCGRSDLSSAVSNCKLLAIGGSYIIYNT